MRPEECPEREFHGNPFRYCGVKGCGWTEAAAVPVVHPEPGDATTPDPEWAGHTIRERRWQETFSAGWLEWGDTFDTRRIWEPLMAIADAEVAAAVAAVRADRDAEVEGLRTQLAGMTPTERPDGERIDGWLIPRRLTWVDPSSAGSVGVSDKEAGNE